MAGSRDTKLCLRDICGKRRPRSACATAQADQSLRFSLTKVKLLAPCVGLGLYCNRITFSFDVFFGVPFFFLSFYWCRK